MKIYGIDITVKRYIFKDYADTEVLVDIEDIEDEDFINIAEKQGFVWSLEGFINALNRDEINTGGGANFFRFRAIDNEENA